jgi:alpha-galactosidase
MKKNKVNFISYNGVFPCLCQGTLIVKIGKKFFNINRALISQGGFDEDWNATIGDWAIDVEKLPKDFPTDYIDDLIKIVNDNIEKGCCGGCN